jgi:membrane associated rhomboid family serine protease
MNEIAITVLKNLKSARFSYLVIFYCLAVFIGIHLVENKETISDATLTLFGAPTAIDIYSGKQWGLITNSFVHFEFGHLVVNLLTTLLIASFVERRIGFWKLFFFGLIASYVSSAIQLSFSDDAGIGLSGVNYALFGFIFGKTFLDQRFRIVTKNLALAVMLFFIPFCEFMNRFFNWNVATIALTSGLTFGILFSVLFSNYKRYALSILVIMGAFSMGSVFYAPWSAEWYCSKGIEEHENGNIKAAKSYYLKAYQLNPNSFCAKNNLKLIRIDELSAEALELHMRKKYIEAGRLYDEILRLDPKNRWAEANKNRLP